MIIAFSQSYGKTIRLEKNIVNGKNVLVQAMFNEERATYVVQDEFDLLGETLSLPKGAKLLFAETGALNNGCLIGDESDIVAEPQSKILFDIQFKGSWKVKDIYSDWFNMGNDAAVNTRNFKSMCALTSNDYDGTIHVLPGTYPIKVDNKQQSVLVLNSNTTLHLDGTLQLVANDLPYYAIIDVVEKRNVMISGSGVIRGDVTTHTGTQGEWGMGVIVRASNNVKIRNLTVKECWGDCIYLGQTSNESFSNIITIENVTCDAGRRQGMSIIAGKNILVKDCKFINTGTIKYTSPGAGIDIEPNHAGTVTRRIVIDNCQFYGNKGHDIATKNLNKRSKVIIRNCTLNYSLGFWEDSYNITVENCTINSLNASNEVTNIKIKKSIIRKRIPERVKSVVKLEKCRLNNEATLTLATFAIPVLAISVCGLAIWGLTIKRDVA